MAESLTFTNQNRQMRTQFHLKKKSSLFWIVVLQSHFWKLLLSQFSLISFLKAHEFQIKILIIKTLKAAKNTEVSVRTDVTHIWQSSLDDKSRTFFIPFAVANIKYNILGTSFFEKHVKWLDVEKIVSQFSRIN